MIWGLCLGAAFGLIGFAWLANLQRARLKMNIELKPNLLMPASPLLFIEPKTSLFYFKNPLNFIPDFLTAHGYEVYTLRLKSRKDPKRAQELETLLQEFLQAKKHFHVFFELSSWESLKQLLETRSFENIPSWTLLDTDIPAFSKALKHSILPCQVPSSEPVAFWGFHQRWLRLSKQVRPVGLSADPKDYENLLAHIQILAEREFVAKSSKL